MCGGVNHLCTHFEFSVSAGARRNDGFFKRRIAGLLDISVALADHRFGGLDGGPCGVDPAGITLQPITDRSSVIALLGQFCAGSDTGLVHHRRSRARGIVNARCNQ